MSKRQRQQQLYAGRHWFLLGLMLLGLTAVFGRAVYLQLFATDYLQAQGDARYLRSVEIAPSRGMILDRNGEPLAISAPVDSIWADPGTLGSAPEQWPELATALGVKVSDIKTNVENYAGREFMYLKRHLSPPDAQKIVDLKIPGVSVQREYRRYYPAGPIFGHVLGFTNVDDQGQEGLELAYNKYLAGTPGKKRVMRDRKGHVVEDVESIHPVEDGKDLSLSLDSRIQYMTYRYLQSAVREHDAKGGSAVVLDAKNGEILAMVNEPTFNPNNRSGIKDGKFRNRAVTDVLEPGSTVKPFTIAMALDSGRFSPATAIDTSPGWLRIGRHTIRDVHDYGELTVSAVITKSSNVGVAKIALQLPVADLITLYRRIGFGELSGSSLPGEVVGSLVQRNRWREIEHATLAYGYGVSVTPLQLARAYTALASDGKLLPVTMIKRTGAVRGEQVIDPDIASQVRSMLETVAGSEGTAKLARLAQYRVAGKTGTVHKLDANGRYAPKRYLSLFVGFVPVSDPRFVMAVVVDEPRGKKYYGGQVAAPVFAGVMKGALRLRNVAPDLPLEDHGEQRHQVALSHG